jgi:hypothetical protein
MAIRPFEPLGELQASARLPLGEKSFVVSCLAGIGLARDYEERSLMNNGFFPLDDSIA